MAQVIKIQMRHSLDQTANSRQDNCRRLPQLIVMLRSRRQTQLLVPVVGAVLLQTNRACTTLRYWLFFPALDPVVLLLIAIIIVITKQQAITTFVLICESPSQCVPFSNAAASVLIQTHGPTAGRSQ